MLELFILVECKDRPSSGKDLVAKATLLSDGTWKPSAGSIYPLLQKMEKGGLIKASLRKQEKGRREIAYAITGKGKAVLEAGKEKLESSMHTTLTAVNPILFRIAHEFDGEQLEEAKRFWKAMMDLRTLMMAEPRRELRHRRFIRLFKMAQREIELMKTELGLEK